MADAPSSPDARARHLIAAATNLTVASVSAAGEPWASPVFYAPDDALDLFWTSEPAAQHSQNIRATGTVALVVVEPDPEARVDALYMSATAHELSDPAEIAAAIGVLRAKPQPERWTISDPRDVGPEGPWRIYRAHPASFSVRDTVTVQDKAVARRVPADPRAVRPA